MPATAPTKQKPTQAKSAFQSQSAPSRRPRNTKGFFFSPQLFFQARRQECSSRSGSGEDAGWQAPRDALALCLGWVRNPARGLALVPKEVVGAQSDSTCCEYEPRKTMRRYHSKCDPTSDPPPDESDICHANAMGAKRVGPSLITIKIATDFTWNSSESIFVCVCDICCQYHTFR